MLTVHYSHSLQHCFPILLPHFNLIVHSFNFFECPSEPSCFGIVFQIDLLDDAEFFLQLLSLSIFRILVFLSFDKVFPKLKVSLRFLRRVDLTLSALSLSDFRNLSLSRSTLSSAVRSFRNDRILSSAFVYLPLDISWLPQER